MGIISLDDVVGYRVKAQIVCKNCIEKQEFFDITENTVLPREVVDAGNDMYFCDRCKERL